MAEIIQYPSEINTDRKKLEAVYSLLEQARVEHNRQGAIARSDWARYEEKWQQYAKIFRIKTAPLRVEYLRLKDLIRKSLYTNNEWNGLMDSLRGEEKFQLLTDLYGDKQVLSKIKTNATSVLIDQLKAINLDNLNGQFVDPLEDWTGYTETDPNSVLTVAANQITFTNIQRQSACTVYSDKGAGHFGATFQHKIDTRLTAQSGNDFDDMALFWGVANTTTPNYSTDPLITVYWTTRPSTGNAHIYLMVDDGATDQSDATAQIALNTIFYLTIDKNATDTDCMLYSNSSRTTLLDTLTVANGSTAYQYMHNGFARGGSTVGTMSGDIYNLDLQEGGATNYTFSGSDRLSLSEVLSKITRFKKILQNSIILNEIFSKSVNFPEVLSDSILLQDSFDKRTNFGKLLSDALALNESFSKRTNFLKTFSDSLTLLDVITLGGIINHVISVSDAILLSEILVKNANFKSSFLEEISLAESFNIVVPVITKKDEGGGIIPFFFTKLKQGRLRYWYQNSWQEIQIKVFLNNRWQIKPLKFYNGKQWVEIS